MWLQKLLGDLVELTQENFKAFIIIIITISLTTVALFLARNFSEQRDQNFLALKAIQYRTDLVRQITSEEDQLVSLVRASENKAPKSFQTLANQIIDNYKNISFVEIRSPKGKLLFSKNAPNSDEGWSPDTRAELPPSEVIQFIKAVDQQKNLWSLSYAPDGKSGLELLIPSSNASFVLVTRTSPKHLLPPLSGISLAKGIGVNFSEEMNLPKDSNGAVLLPLDLNDISANLIFKVTEQKAISFDNSFFIVFLLGISLCILMVSFFNETRKNKLMQARLSEQEKTLAKQAQLSTLGEISTTLAHELNQPLATITNYVATCEIRLKQLGFQDNILSKALNDARGQTLRAGEVVQSIRNYLQKGSTVKATVEVEEAITRLHPIINALTKEKRSNFTVETKPGLLVRIDPALFEQIILNLCKNALDAMADTIPAKRHLSIRSNIVVDTHDKRWIHIDVSDTGHGVSEENSKKLFESFFTTKSEGMGIGLSLSRSVTESHGGKIAWANNAHGGATFSIILPQFTTE